MLATIQWDGGTTGDGTNFLDPVNWVGDVLPGAADTAVIVATGTSPTITISGTTTVGQIQTNRNVQLSGGTIRNSAVTVTGGAKLLATTSGGTLDGVTVSGDLNLQNYASLTAYNGLTIGGTVTLGKNCRIDFSGTQTLGGTGTIVFGEVGEREANALRCVTDGMTLTIGSGITIRGGGSVDGDYTYYGYYGYESRQQGTRIGSVNTWDTDYYAKGAANVTVVNQGTIIADGSGKKLVIQPSGTGTFTNTGTIGADNGARLTVTRAAGSLATTTVSGSGSSLVVDGTFTLDQRLTAAADQTISLSGTWVSSGGFAVEGGTLNLGGTWSTSNGITVNGGTLNLGGDPLPKS